MKKALAAATLSLVTLLASAEKADSLKPVEVAYRTIDVDQVTQTYIATDAVITRGTLVLKSDKALIKETPEGFLSVTLTSNEGKLATFRQKRDGGDLWVEGQAQRIEYDERVELVKLFTTAKVRELEGTRMTNEINGEFISYDNRKEVATASGETKPGQGRGKMILSPRRTAPAPVAAPAAGKQ